jgi:hypothetical protein
VEQHLRGGEGTLILDHLNKHESRIWWTPEPLLDLAPCPPVSEEDLDTVRFSPDDVFSAWCNEVYTHPVTGRAVLTDRGGLPRPRGFPTSAQVRELYPVARVCAIVRASERALATGRLTTSCS